MLPEKGINKDVEKEYISDEYSAHAQNVVKDRQGSYENEPGTTLDHSEGSIIIYELEHDYDRVLFITDETNHEIALIRNGIRTSVINQSWLNFSKYHPVLDAEAKRNSFGELIVAFTDNTNPPRVINIDSPNASNAEDIEIFDRINQPIISNTDIQYSGGSLLTGAYLFAARLVKNEGKSTNFSVVRGPVYITNESTSTNYKKFDGAAPKTPTSNAIELTISNISTGYDRIEIAVYKYQEGVFTTVVLPEIQISGSSIRYLYTGAQQETTINDEEILIKQPAYLTSKSLTQINNVLYQSNLTGLNPDDIDTQKYANLIKINYTYEIFDPIFPDQQAKSGFKSNEVYAFYRAFKLKDGTITPFDHIPGRPPENIYVYKPGDAVGAGNAYGEVTDSNGDKIKENTSIDTSALENYLRDTYGDNFRDLNLVTTGNANYKPLQILDTSENPNASTNMGYWQNGFGSTAEKYPDIDSFDSSSLSGGEDLRDTPVRHHKFPSLTRMLDKFNNRALDTERGSLSVNLTLSTNDTMITNETDKLSTVPHTILTGINDTYIKFTTSVRVEISYELDYTIDWDDTDLEDAFIIEIKRSDKWNSNNFSVINSVTESNTSSTTSNTLTGTVEIQSDERIYVKSELNNSGAINKITGTFKITSLKTVAGNEAFLNITKGIRFGIDVSNIVVPSELEGKVDEILIAYAERDFNNATCPGQSLHQYASFPGDEGNNSYRTDLYWGSGGNIRIDNNNSNRSLIVNQDKIEPTHHYWRCYDFYMLNNRQYFNVDFVDIQHTTGIRYHNAQNKSGDAVFRHDSTEDRTYLESPSYTSKYRQVDNSRSGFAPSNSIDAFEGERTIYNNHLEGAGYLYVHDSVEFPEERVIDGSGDDNGEINIPVGDQVEVLDNSVMEADDLSGERYFKTGIYDLRRVIEKIYESFWNQNLILTDKSLQINTQGTYSINNIFGGDIFPSYTSHISLSARDGNGHFDVDQWYIRYIYAYFLETIGNANLRHEGGSNVERFYPSTDAFEFSNEGSATITGGQDINSWRYNIDYSVLNQVNGIFPRNPFNRYTNQFPYRIIKSVETDQESPGFEEWTRYLPNDYKEMPRNKGVIWNIDAYNDRLIIHHEYSLFVTLGREFLSAESTEVTLGTGDIFQNEPDELVSIPHTFGGTHSQQASIVTKFGYVIIDDVNKLILLFSGKINNIGGKGLRRFLLDNAELKVNQQLSSKLDNPIAGYGWTVGYDREYDRLLLTKRDIELTGTLSEYSISNGQILRNGSDLTEDDYKDVSFTISYNTNFNLISFHTYHPSFYSQGIFSNLVLDNNLFKFTSDLRGTYYANTDKEFTDPSFIDYIINNKGKEIRIVSVQWLTDFIENNQYKYDKTISHIAIYNDYKSTGLIDLEAIKEVDPYTSGIDFNGNIRNIKGWWKFNRFRDLSVIYKAGNNEKIINNNFTINTNAIDDTQSFNEKGRMDGTWFVIRLMFDNSTNDKVRIKGIIPSIKKSIR